MKYIEFKTIYALTPQSMILQEMGIYNEDSMNQSRYIQNCSYYPPYTNTYTEYLPIGK